ncbi:MAG: GAF domain-containing protein [Euryarchaeota archaeon]|nr:GAF domain-containing protein [Euryarchaeota archaeon]MBV1729530.1 GAF domain-containing protein [Methanobacterium sp.]MBU4547245.1 GAF domain-containing protein [Euryarchaeota archaeon]MBU4607247.1 GAF domain-containing protein [Euryarchaeota archaeon]MBV1754349.1 GAF domain-containing protein [Methanobacterium sp.]
MEEISDTERLIISYIKSHPPEECMLDKITRGTSRSRATVLKYLGILHAKGILDYYFVGRSKLWTLKQEMEKKATIKSESIKPEIQQDTSELASRASKLHTLMSKELSLKKSIDYPDTIVFTINTYNDIVATNDTFNTFFPGKRNLREIILPEQVVMFENALHSLNLDNTIAIEIDLMEKPGVYRPYKLSLQSIVDNEDITGTTIIGEELSQFKRTKRELETLLTITQAAGSAQNEEQLMKEVAKGINDLILCKYCIVFLKDGKKLRSAYEIPATLAGDKILPYINGFTEKSMDSLETISARDGNYYLETIKSELGDTSITMMLAVPIIDEDTAIGVIILLTTLNSVSSINIENVEMAADELAGYLKIQRLSNEKEEFANTLLAMNRISDILNSVTAEDEMLERSVTSTVDSLGFEMGCIYLTDDEEELTLRVHKNLPENLRKMCITGMFKDLFSKALEKQNLMYITSESEEYGFLDPAIRESGIKTLLILLIKSGNKIIGLLNMGSRQIKAYNEVSLENLGSIGLQLGLALERSKLAIKLKAEK